MLGRRQFFKQLTNGTIGVGLGSIVSASKDSSYFSLAPKLPKALFPGARIGVISPSSSLSRGNYAKMIKNLEGFGYELVYTENLRVKKGFLGGTDQQRLEDLHLMFKDNSIDGIICSRGGYGASRLLNDIDYDLIADNPKVIIGYSDITALLLAIYKKTGLVCFHGPNGDSNYTEFSTQRIEQLMINKIAEYKLSIKDESLQTIDMESMQESTEEEIAAAVKMLDRPTPFKVLKSGQATGSLIGGNLTLISTLMGTPYEPDFSDRIVFIEDIGESPYRIDRMLTQLLLSGKLQEAKGLMLGNFKDCEADPESADFPDSFSLIEVFEERFKELDIPIVVGMPFGHIRDNGVIPLGVDAELNANEGTLSLLGPAVA